MAASKSPSDNTSPIDKKFNPAKLNDNNHASELRDYIDTLHPSAQANLLAKLHLLNKSSTARVNQSTTDARGGSLLMDEDVAKNLWATSLKPPDDTVLKTEDDDDDADNAATYPRIMNAGGIRSGGTIPSHQLCSGFQLTPLLQV